MLKWAETEHALFRLLQHYAGVDAWTANVAWSSAKGSPMMAMLKTLISRPSISAARRDDVTFVLPQIAMILTARDRIAHHGRTMSLMHFQGSTVIPDRERLAKARVKQQFRIGVPALQAMFIDLDVVEKHLERHLLPGRFRPHAPADGRSWLYRSPPPEDAGDGSRKAPRKS